MQTICVCGMPPLRDTALLCFLVIVGAGAIAPLQAQRRNTVPPIGTGARQAVYAPLLGAGAAVAPSPGLGATAPREGRSTPALATGGVLGGAVGLVAGGLAGLVIGDKACDDLGNPDACEDELFTGLGIGAALGEATLLPLGVHLADRRRGSYPRMLLASLAIAGAGVGLVAATDGHGARPILISSALLQLVATTMIERRTAER